MRFIVERVSSVWLAWLDTRERWMTDRVSGFGTPLCSYTCRRVDCRRKEPQLVSCLLLFTQSATRQARVLDYCIQKGGLAVGRIRQGSSKQNPTSTGHGEVYAVRSSPSSTTRIRGFELFLEALLLRRCNLATHIKCRGSINWLLLRCPPLNFVLFTICWYPFVGWLNMCVWFMVKHVQDEMG
jgi:hypothetical protein